MHSTTENMYMFGTNMEHPSRMLTYKAAFNKWQRIKPIRGRSDQNTRPLARRGNDNLTIRQDEGSKDIVVRLYNTDIVRYSAEGDGYNNTIELGPYPSSMTNRVVWSLLCPHVNPLWGERDYSQPNYITEVNGRYYNTPEYALIQPGGQGRYLQPGERGRHPGGEGWHIVGGQKPFEVPILDRKATKAALKRVDYPMFVTWLKTRIKLGADPRATGWRSQPYDWSPSQAVGYLTYGETGWAELAGRMAIHAPLDRELESLRRAVYTYEMCYDIEEVPYFDSYTKLRAALGRMHRAQ